MRGLIPSSPSTPDTSATLPPADSPPADSSSIAPADSAQPSSSQDAGSAEQHPDALSPSESQSNIDLSQLGYVQGFLLESPEASVGGHAQQNVQSASKGYESKAEKSSGVNADEAETAADTREPWPEVSSLSSVDVGFAPAGGERLIDC